jgi:hypothetical protein
MTQALVYLEYLFPKKWKNIFEAYMFNGSKLSKKL